MLGVCLCAPPSRPLAGIASSIAAGGASQGMSRVATVTTLFDCPSGRRT